MPPSLTLSARCLGLACLAAVPLPALAQTTATAISGGAFQDADRSHRGAGMATLVRTSDDRVLLQFTEFSVTPGPDLEVWLVADGAPATSAAVLASTWLSLGPLQAPEGDQAYVVPEDVDLAQFGSVVIWCEDFSVLFAVATLD